MTTLLQHESPHSTMTEHRLAVSELSVLPLKLEGHSTLIAGLKSVGTLNEIQKYSFSTELWCLYHGLMASILKR